MVTVVYHWSWPLCFTRIPTLRSAHYTCESCRRHVISTCDIHTYHKHLSVCHEVFVLTQDVTGVFGLCLGARQL